jgi:hypothetical protein
MKQTYSLTYFSELLDILTNPSKQVHPLVRKKLKKKFYTEIASYRRSFDDDNRLRRGEL